MTTTPAPQFVIYRDAQGRQIPPPPSMPPASPYTSPYRPPGYNISPTPSGISLQRNHLIAIAAAVALAIVGLVISTHHHHHAAVVPTTTTVPTVAPVSGACGPKADKDCYEYGYAVGYSVVTENLAEGADSDSIISTMPSACAGAAHNLDENITGAQREAFASGCVGSTLSAIDGTNPPADPLPVINNDGSSTGT